MSFTSKLRTAVLAVGLAVPMVVAAPSVTTVASANGSAWVNTNDRNAVVAAYNAEFGTSNPGPGWTGDRGSCSPGTTSQSYRNAIFDRINYFRAMAGVPADVVENQSYSASAQQAALMMSATGALSHSPSAGSFACWTGTGAAAAGKSDLYLGRSGPESITGYIEDPGAGNFTVGHRSWILHPTTSQMGSGDIPAGAGWASNALYVIGDDVFDPQPTMREGDGFVAWPPRGFVPGELVFPRWSFSLRGASFSSASVSVTRAGSSVPVTIEHRGGATSGAPFAVIVWNVSGVDTSPAVDTTYTVNVSGVQVGGQTRSFSYDVRVLGDAPAGNPSDFNAYVNRAYNDFLGRNPSAGERNTWTTLLAGGLSRYDFVRSLASSDEWTAHVVDQMYWDTLGRAPDSAGRAYWVGRLQAGMSVAQVAADFYGSPEYIAGEGGTYQAWLTDLYGELLQRSPDSGGLSFWISEVNSRGSGPVAYDFYQSEESRRTRVTELYQKFLGRNPDSAGLSYWAGVLSSGDDLALAADLAASQEYFADS